MRCRLLVMAPMASIVRTEKNYTQAVLCSISDDASAACHCCGCRCLVMLIDLGVAGRHVFIFCALFLRLCN